MTHPNRDALLELADVEVTGTTFPGGAPDAEVAAIMSELSDLQTWCVMMMRKDSGGMPAAELVQRTRVLIVERLYPAARASTTPNKDENDGPA